MDGRDGRASWKVSSNLGQSLSRGKAATAPFTQGSLGLRGTGRTSLGHRSSQQPQAGRDRARPLQKGGEYAEGWGDERPMPGSRSAGLSPTSFSAKRSARNDHRRQSFQLSSHVPMSPVSSQRSARARLSKNSRKLRKGFQRKGRSPSFGRFKGGWGVFFSFEKNTPQRQRAPARSPHSPPRGRQKPAGFPGTPGGVSEPRCPQGRPYSFSPVRPSRTRRSAIMAMNSELVGLPLVLETV